MGSGFDSDDVKGHVFSMRRYGVGRAIETT
jgi:hypothetical protein